MTKKANVLLFSLLACTLCLAQKAPDFTISDYNGQTHTLYEDYLDEGKVVMLKIMFVACPPCNLSAPGVQSLYEEFGEGMEDVQFFDLSNKSWDSNDAMRGFGEKHGLTFPGAGADGGSLSAVAPYTSGTYGPFFGTPTFVVIDPQGNVNFKVPMQDLRAAIEDAMGDENGCASAFGGNINSNSSDPQVLISSEIQGSQTYMLPVDDQNNYAYECEFQLPPMSLDFNLHVEEDGDDLEGVSVKDIIMITRHLLGITFFETSEEKIAADYTANGVLSARDISELRKLVVGLDAENEYHNAWIYWHETTDFSDDTTGVLIPDLITSVRLSDVVDSLVTGNFEGVKLGDVSGDINPFFKEITTRSQEQKLQFEDRWVEKGEWVTTVLTSEANFVGIQMGIKLAPNAQIDVLSPNWSVLSNNDAGLIKMVAHTQDGQPHELVVQIKYQAQNSGLLSSQLEISEEYTSLGVAEDSEGPIRLTTSSQDFNPVFSPNPTNGRLVIQSGIPIRQVNLLSNDGRVISSLELDNGPLQTELVLPAKGVYMVQMVDQNGSVHIEKVIRQ